MNFEMGMPRLRALSNREHRIFQSLIWAALYAIPAVAVAEMSMDPDMWWHLRVGQWIQENGAVPRTDPFSAYGMGRPWIAYSWLFEVLVYGLFQVMGFYGILLYRTCLAYAVAAAIHYFVAKRESRFMVQVYILFPAFLALGLLMTARPWMLTILFSTVTLDLVLDLREGKKRRHLWLFPLLFALWANIHIQFIYGLLMMMLGCAVPAGECRGRLLKITGACFVGTLFNPYHLGIYGVVIEYARDPGPYRYVLELLAPTFRHPAHWATLAMAGAAAFMLGRRPQRSFFHLALLSGAVILSFRSVRDIWTVVLASAAILAGPPSGSRPLKVGCGVAADGTGTLTRLDKVIVAGAVVSILLTLGYFRGLSGFNRESSFSKDYPVQASAFVEKLGYPGPLYNHFNWGGYLIWRLPQLPVSMDGRTNLHGHKRIARSLKTWGGAADWNSDTELAASSLVIAGMNNALTSLLRLDPRFRLVYEDTVAAVFVSSNVPR